MSAMEWVDETWRTYVGNAASVRDFRVQMRGTKTILAWSIYLFVLLLVAYTFYMNVARNQEFSASAAGLQSTLRSSFSTILNTVAAAIAVIAPGLTAASIVGERQRKSFDLVFSAPVTPKYYLVGKMIASYRYTIMLLVLSIPVLALTAMLGGATWGDIAICYFLLSMNGLVLCSIALLVSAIVEKVQPAVAASYMLVGIYVLATLMISTYLLYAPMLGVTSGPVGEKPFVATLNPFMVDKFYGTYTMIGTTQVPNWILNAVYTIAFVRLALLGAGSSLSSFNSKETKSLRLQGIGYLLLLTLLFAYFPMTSTRSSGYGFFVSFLFWGLLMLVPWIVAWGDSPRRITASDGPWRFRTMLSGAPSGAGAYLLALVLAIAIGSWFVMNWKGIPFASLAAHLVHGVGVLVFFAGATRWFCSRLGYPRGKLFSSMVIIASNVIMPVFLLIAISSSHAYGMGIAIDQRLEWLAWPMWPIATNLSLYLIAFYGVIANFIGLALWWSAEKRAAALRRHVYSPPEWQFEGR